MEQYIRFRGKRRDNGEWVYGYVEFHLVDGDLTETEHRAFITFDIMDKIGKVYRYTFEVIPETIGRYSGMEDKDWKAIYQGDVISLITADGEAITIECRFGKVKRQIYENLVEITGFYFVRSNDGRKTFPIVNNYLHKHDTEIWEVIGNIHDNPELLNKEVV